MLATDLTKDISFMETTNINTIVLFYNISIMGNIIEKEC